jgi:hypothetical protein
MFVSGHAEAIERLTQLTATLADDQKLSRPTVVKLMVALANKEICSTWLNIPDDFALDYLMSVTQ